jgi:hypothetical protein
MKCIYYAGILSEDPKINLEIKNIHKKIIKKNNKLKNFNVMFLPKQSRNILQTKKGNKIC